MKADPALTRKPAGKRLGAIVSPDPLESAKAASLRYVTDDKPGISRQRRGAAFQYIDPSGKVIRDPEELQRIKSLAIPPAWREVWICPLRNGHLQATGRDAKGRKQHRYHPRWREVRDENKYGRIVAFAKALPLIRQRVDSDLRLPGLPRDKILATVVRLLETSHIRVGNEEYARQNKSFGLATLRNRHVNVSGSTIRFEFRGKSGVQHALDINDRRLARIIKRCQDLPGYELFQYVDDDGERRTIDSSDVNEYIRQIAGEEFSTQYSSGHRRRRQEVGQYQSGLPQMLYSSGGYSVLYGRVFATRFTPAPQEDHGLTWPRTGRDGCAEAAESRHHLEQ
jgi:DNA topoisomerase-1